MNDHFAGRSSVVPPQQCRRRPPRAPRRERPPGPASAGSIGRIMHQRRSASTSNAEIHSASRRSEVPAWECELCSPRTSQRHRDSGSASKFHLADLHVQLSAGVRDGHRQCHRRSGRRPRHPAQLATVGADGDLRAVGTAVRRTPARIEIAVLAGGKVDVRRGGGRRRRGDEAKPEPVPDPPHRRRLSPGGAGRAHSHTCRAPPTLAAATAQRCSIAQRGCRRRRIRGQPDEQQRTIAAGGQQPSVSRRGRRCRSIAKRARSRTASPTQTRPAPANGISSTAMARW